MKHKKTLFLIYLFVLFIIKVNGQSLSPSLISNAGNYSTNNSNSMTWTLGDLVVSTQRNNNNTLSQGFLQVYKSTVSTDEEKELNNYRFYPNPTHQSVIVESLENQIIDHYTVYDLSGKALFQSGNQSAKLEIDFSNFSSGNYIIKLMSNSETISQKIIKH